MSRRPDENGQLDGLLRALPAPEPSAEFRADARRRYIAAIAARERHEVVVGLVAALIGLAMTAMLLGPVVEPTALVSGAAEAVAELARWTTGVGVVLALVPLTIWISVVLGCAAATLSLALIARERSLALAK